MLNLKKLIASVSAVALTLSTVAFAANYTDVAEDSAYYEAVESLSKLGIVTGYEDGSYKPEETVTRAEMAALIARIQGYDETAKNSANTIFTDVPSENWASGYVAQATNQGIINGYGDGTFGPDDPVLYEQAVKMIMATLGYTPYAKNNGDYPTGYLAAASRYEVTKGVSNAVIGSGANRGTIAQLLSNAIDTPLMAQSKWNTDGSVEYTIYDGTDNAYKTLMSENLGVVKLKGIVKANSVSSLTGAVDIDTNEEAKVTITVTGNYDTNNKDFEAKYNSNGVLLYYGDSANQEFVVADSDAEDFLGKAVIFYVMENDNDDYEIISIAADSSKNDVLTFTLDQFDVVETVPSSTATGTIRYYKNESDKTSTKKTLSKDVDVVYNGVGGQTLTTVLSDAANAGYVAGNGKCKFGGQVTLIDNDGITGYDVVMVEVAATGVVKSVSSDGTVAFKKAAVLPDGGSLSSLDIDVDDETQKIVITKDGEEIEFSELAEWDVLSILAANDDADYITAEVISNPVVGTISADYNSDTSLGGKGFRIDGNKYDVAQGAYEATNLSVGDGGTFYIDKYGKIAAFNEDSALASGVSGNYGYVWKAIAEDDSIDDTTVTLQLVTANGVEIFDLATSVKFKGNGIDKTLKPADANITGNTVADANTFFGQALAGQVIKYTKNSSNRINNITLADYNDKFELIKSDVTGTFDADNGKVGSTYIDDDAVIFFIDDSDVDKCSIGTLADFEDETSYTLLKVYADNKATDNNIVVVKGGLDNVGAKSNVAVITDVAKSENEDGDEIYSLTYLLDGAEVTADTVATSDIKTSLDTLTEGDVVKVKTNSAGKVNNIQFVWNFKDGVRSGAETLTPGGLVTSGDEVFDGGAVYSYKDTSEEVTFKSGKSYKLSKASNVYVIDATGRNVTVKNGSSSNYKYYEDLYEADNKVEIKIDGNVQATVNPGKVDEFAAYTDYVYVRQYDSKVVDVVIVKGPNNVRTSVTKTAVDPEKFTVSFDVNGGTSAAPAAQTVEKDKTATKPADPTPATGKVFKFWATSKTATEGYDFATKVTADVTLYAIYDVEASSTEVVIDEVVEEVVEVVE